MQLSRPLLARLLVPGTLAVVLLGTAACGGDDTDKATDDATKQGGTSQPSGPKAAWSKVTIPAQQLQGGTAAALDDPLAAGPGGPAVFAGTSTEPDQPSKAAVWTAGSTKPTLLDVPGDATVSHAVANGSQTLVFGFSTTKGRDTNWMQSSDDRVTWKPVDLPADLDKRDAELAHVVPLGDGQALLIGLDDKHQLFSQPLSGGTPVELPAPPGKTRYQGVAAAAANGGTLLVLASATRPDGTRVLVGLRSTDAGKTWTQVKAPGESGASVYGLVPVGKSFVATGYVSLSVARPAAWSSTDGSSWTREQVPTIPLGHDGWDAYLSTPTVRGDTVYASGINGENLAGFVLQRKAGAWSILGSTADGGTPGTYALAAPTEDGVATATSEDGQVGFGELAGSWHSTGTTGTPKHTGDWSTPGVFDGSPDLPYSRVSVDLEPNHGWTRTYTSQLVHLDAQGGQIREASPAAAAAFTSPAVASARDGTTVVAGTVNHNDDAPDHGDDTDIGAYVKGPDGGWKTATGLTGPRTEQIASLQYVDGSWVVLGYDRADFAGSAHEFGAVWVSKDGRTWKRQQGGFDVTPTQNSYLTSTCRSAAGLVVVGGASDDARGSKPTAFRRTGGDWKPVDLAPLGKDLQGLSGCVGTGDVTLFQGSTAEGRGLWRTTDLASWDKVAIGGLDDSVSTIRPVAGGFAAAGGQYDGLLAQPVVWLSADGRSWTSVDVTSERTLAGDDVVEWKHDDTTQLVVLLSGRGGPEVQTLDNVTALLAAAKKK
ncbi:MAG: hypothetical protein JWO46_5 [Nocardioidaceae bacterium]|nr:hypothetical protein [Nocardioidaceae bacterium]